MHLGSTTASRPRPTKEPPLRAIANSLHSATDTIAQIASISVDAAIKSEMFEKVPVLNVIAHAVEFLDAGMKIKLARNTAAFLRAAQTGDPAKAQKAFDRIYGDPRFSEEIPDTVLQILTDSHKPLKAELVGRMFVAVGADQLRVEEFETLSLIVLQASIPALRALKELGDLAPSGQATMPFRGTELLVGMGVANANRGAPSLTNLGHKLYVFGFGTSVPVTFIE